MFSNWRARAIISKHCKHTWCALFASLCCDVNDISVKWFKFISFDFCSTFPQLHSEFSQFVCSKCKLMRRIKKSTRTLVRYSWCQIIYSRLAIGGQYVQCNLLQHQCDLSQNGSYHVLSLDMAWKQCFWLSSIGVLSIQMLSTCIN